MRENQIRNRVWNLKLKAGRAEMEGRMEDAEELMKKAEWLKEQLALF